jgi:cold shock CspA family protein
MTASDYGAESYSGAVYKVDLESNWSIIRTSDNVDVWARSSVLQEMGLELGHRVIFKLCQHENGALEAISIRSLNQEYDLGVLDALNQEQETNISPAVDRQTALATDSLANSRQDSGFVGKVKWFDASRGAGFITPDSGDEDVRVYRDGIVDERYRNLAPTEPVRFEIKSYKDRGGSQRTKAVNVKSLLSADRVRGTVQSFDHSKGLGYIARETGGPAVRVHYTSIMGRSMSERTLEEDELVEFSVRESGREPEAKKVKRLDPRPPLYRFAKMGRDGDWTRKLARLAQEENWEYSTTTDGFPVLRSYIVYTFRRLQEEYLEGKKTLVYGEQDGRKYASFNTGLVTEFQERIYALFGGKDPSGDGCEWELQDFYKASDERMHGKFDKFPQQATYWTDPSVLVYDYLHTELYVNYRHIAGERIERFPEYIEGNVEEAAHLLETVCAKAVDRVVQNYKVAVPQYYRGEVQLLLPICLKNPRVADLALVVSKNGNQYRGDTALPLDQAYNNARLLTRPDRDWLRP